MKSDFNKRIKSGIKLQNMKGSLMSQHHSKDKELVEKAKIASSLANIISEIYVLIDELYQKRHDEN